MAEIGGNQAVKVSAGADVDAGRRDMLKTIGVGTMALGTSVLGSGAVVSAPAAPRAEGATHMSGPYNFLFILTDQERYFRPGELPGEYGLPAHERLAKTGIVFENHQINSSVCISSCSVLYTGQHIQQTMMFDNTNLPWISSLSTDIPTVGHMVREAGFCTAYRGKWHPTKESDGQFADTGLIGPQEGIPEHSGSTRHSISHERDAEQFARRMVTERY
jgi:arylsulfatase